VCDKPFVVLLIGDVELFYGGFDGGVFIRCVHNADERSGV
jgi:hypothetical protein